MHTHRGTAGTYTAFSATAVASTGTANGDWQDAKSGESYNIFCTLASTGTPDINLFFDFSPLSKETLTSSSTTASYASVKLIDALATKTVLQGPYNAAANADNKTYMDYPFLSWRLRAVGDGSNPADTTITAYVVRFN